MQKRKTKNSIGPGELAPKRGAMMALSSAELKTIVGGQNDTANNPWQPL